MSIAHDFSDSLLTTPVDTNGTGVNVFEWYIYSIRDMIVCMRCNILGVPPSYYFTIEARVFHISPYSMWTNSPLLMGIRFG